MSWPITQTTPKFSNSLVGFTTRMDLRFKIRRLRSLTSLGVSRPVRRLHCLSPTNPSHQSHVLDPHDAQSWYLLGRAYMAGQKYNKAYEAYQQAVYRDGRNPTFWCSIGVLYFQINQYRDALDAYSRAIRINPYISEVWFDLGSLYESCNNQISDAIDAYARAAELDPRNTAITQRLELLKQAQATGAQLPAAPGPQDVHPTAYANTVVQPPGLTGPPLLLQGSNANRVTPRGDLRNGDSNLPLPPPPSTVGPGRPTSPRPFRGGPPPPVIVDESRHNQSRLAPMDVDRPPAHSRDPPSLYPSSRGPSSNRHSSILLHQPVPQPPPSDGRNGHPPHSHDPHFGSSRQIRPPSTSTSPVPRGHTPRTSSYTNHPSQRPPPPGLSHPPRSPRSYPADIVDRDSRRDDRDWDRERRGRHLQEYPAPPPHQMFATRGHSPPYRGHSPGPRSARDYSPPHPSPRNAHQPVPSRSYPSPWSENKPPVTRSPPTQPLPEPHPSRRYDPRNDGRDPRELRDYDPMDTRPDLRSRPPSHHGSPESVRNTLRQPPPPPAYPKRSPSPHITSHPGMQMAESRVPGRRRGSQREKEPEPPYSPSSVDSKRDRKRKNPTGPPTVMKRKEDDGMYIDRPPNSGQPSFRVSTYPTRGESPEPISSGGSAVRSVHQSPIAVPVPPKRYVDEDYDEGVAEVLMDLASYRTHVPTSQPLPPPIQGSSGRASPRPMNSHRGSISSNRGDRDSPALSTGSNQKRPLSPTSADNGGEMKRPKVDGPKLSPSSKQTPTPSTRPSPIPFRTQPTPSSPEVRPSLDGGHYRQTSPSLPAVLPPHPRPIGSGMALPPIATISPTSSGSPGRDEDRMAVDRPHSMTPPPSRAKISEVMNRPNESPTPTPMDREHAH